MKEFFFWSGRCGGVFHMRFFGQGGVGKVFHMRLCGERFSDDFFWPGRFFFWSGGCGES